jgi:hypothetical protein
LLDAMRHQRHIEFTSLVTDILKLTEMSPSMRMKLYVNLDNSIQMRFVIRILKILELQI